MKRSWWRKERVGGEEAAVAVAEQAGVAGREEPPRVGSDVGKEKERAPNPYLDARRAWNSYVDRAYSAQHTWQLVAVAGLLVGLAGVAGIAYVGSKSKFVPYVIEVDKLGEAVAVGPARVAGPADPRVVRASLASFIASARLVTPDVALQRDAIFRVYAMLHSKDPAAQAMNEWYNGNKDASPFVRAAKVTVTTDINSVLPISDTSWQVDWQETTRDRSGALVGQPLHMRAILTVYLEPMSTTTDEAAIERNPLGIYVSTYTWQEVL
jgi:type IV secretion system protein TrbF